MNFGKLETSSSIACSVITVASEMATKVSTRKML